MDNGNFQELMLKNFERVFKELGNVKEELSGVKGEISEVKADIADLKESQAVMKADMAQMKADIADLKESQARMQQDIIRIENDFGKKIDILFYDWRETQKAFNEEIRQELKILSTKVEALQMESSKHDREIRELYLVNLAKNKKSSKE